MKTETYLAIKAIWSKATTKHKMSSVEHLFYALLVKKDVYDVKKLFTPVKNSIKLANNMPTSSSSWVKNPYGTAINIVGEVSSIIHKKLSGFAIYKTKETPVMATIFDVLKTDETFDLNELQEKLKALYQLVK